MIRTQVSSRRFRGGVAAALPIALGDLVVRVPTASTGPSAAADGKTHTAADTKTEMSAVPLATGGKNPVTGYRVMNDGEVPGVLAVMSSAGLDDDSGKWLDHTGLPAKNGVDGGTIAVPPGTFGIAIFSQPLDDAGNRIRAHRGIAAISNALGGNPLLARAR